MLVAETPADPVLAELHGQLKDRKLLHLPLAWTQEEIEQHCQKSEQNLDHEKHFLVVFERPRKYGGCK